MAGSTAKCYVEVKDNCLDTDCEETSFYVITVQNIINCILVNDSIPHILSTLLFISYFY